VVSVAPVTAEFKQAPDWSRVAFVLADGAARLLTVATLLDLATHPDRAAAWALCASALAALRVWLRSLRTERAMLRAYELLLRAMASWDARAVVARREDQRGVAMLMESARSGALSEHITRAELESSVWASLGFLAIAFLRLGASFALLTLAGGAILAAITAPGRRLAQRARAEGWKHYGTLAASMRTLLEACLELRAVGMERAYAETVRQRAGAVTQAELQAIRTTYLTALLPSLLALGALAVPRAWLEALSARGVEFAVLGGAGIALTLGALSALDQWHRSAPARLSFRSLSTQHPRSSPPERVAPSSDASGPIHALRVRGLSVLHPGGLRPTPSGLSFELGPGGVALIGPNGSGKSSALWAILGLLPASSGTVELDGPGGARRIDEARGRLAYLPQNPHVAPDESVRTHLELFGTRPDAAERWQPTLRAFDLDELLRDRGGGDLERGLSTPMGSLSGGEQRRVLLARVFSSGADVLLLDEPEVGLDSDRRTELRSILEAEAVRRIVVLVAHDPGIVPSSFERIALSGGQEPHPSA